MKKITTDQRVLQSMQANLKTNHIAQVGSVVMVGEEPNTTTFIVRDGLVLTGLGVSVELQVSYNELLGCRRQFSTL